MAPSLEVVPALPQTDPVRSSKGPAIAAGVVLAAVGITEAYESLVGQLTVDEAYAGYVALQAVLLGFVLLGARLERRPLRDFGFAIRGPLSTTVAFASVLSMLYLALRIDPGFLFGFGKVPLPSVWAFGFLLLTAPVVALAQVGFFFGYLFRTLSRCLPIRPAIFLSAGAYAVYSTNFLVFSYLNLTATIGTLFTTTMVSFVLGIVLALYCYKAEWSLLGPLTFLASILALNALLPIGAAYPSWEVDFASSLAACAAVLVVVGAGLREPRLQSLKYLGERIGPRRYRFRNRARSRESARSLLVGVAVVGVVAITFAYGLPTVLGTSRPMLAIATGSMVPTLERGTLVVIERVAATQIAVGAIIAFSVPCLPAPTVHRVVQIVHTGPNWVFQTKGDANAARDPCTVPYSAVLGAVVLIVPYAGLLILDPLFAAALVVLIVVLPMAWRELRP